MISFPEERARWFRHETQRELDALLIVDGGAHSVEGQREVHAPLAAMPYARIVGFEPLQEECARLNSAARPGHRYLPVALGDGRPGRFHVCNYALTSSLRRPDTALMERFENLAELCRVTREFDVATARIDDLPELERADFLKLDVQGAAHEVLSGARRCLSKVLCLHVEVEFVPIYEGQRLFSDVDALARECGLMFHHFHRMEGRRTRAASRIAGDRAMQMLWADAVFVPEFARLEREQPSELLKLALIMDLVYESFDLALLCLTHYSSRTGRDLASAYVQLLQGGGVRVA